MEHKKKRTCELKIYFQFSSKETVCVFSSSMVYNYAVNLLIL